MSRVDLIISKTGGLSLTVFVQAETEIGHSGLRRAYVDTGAAYTVLALPKFPGLVYEPGPSVTIGRLDLPECTFAAIQSTIVIRLEGKNQTRSPWLRIPAWLTPDVEYVPNLIGLQGVFETADLHVSLRQDEAYIEFS